MWTMTVTWDSRCCLAGNPQDFLSTGKGDAVTLVPTEGFEEVVNNDTNRMEVLKLSLLHPSLRGVHIVNNGRLLG
jgi:hypothetical protein